MTNNKPNDVRVVPVQLLERIESALRVPDGCPPEIWKEVERTVNGYRAELRAILAQPADQQGEPVAIVVEETHNYGQYLVFGEGLRGAHSPRPVVERKAHLLDQTLPSGTKLYRHAQPAAAKVDERVEFERWTVSEGRVLGYTGWNRDFAVWQARAKLSDVSKVVLPERRAVSEASREQAMCANTWNACLDEVAKLNTPQ
ncbi:hypothetical protein KIH13_12295 [Pseudomonas viridiflava]|nr:hypothetical protein KIH13_12295 [Pseudomonas viridiflava]